MRHAEVVAAADAVSAGRRFFFTRNNLRCELARRGAWKGDAAMFDEELARLERGHGELVRLVRPERVARGPERLEADVLDYAVRRVLVFARLDLLLLFALNGFHRKLEVGLLVADGFPTHVRDKLMEQVRSGIGTTFYAVHDADGDGHGMTEHVRSRIAEHGHARVADVGLTFTQAMKLGLPVRHGRPPVTLGADSAVDAEVRRMLAQGDYVELEELPPIEAMRWVYARLARRAEDVGFG